MDALIINKYGNSTLLVKGKEKELYLMSWTELSERSSVGRKPASCVHLHRDERQC